MIEISPLRPEDRAGWQPLAVGYNIFYERGYPDGTYDTAWRCLMEGRGLHGLAARLDGRMVGLAHSPFHPSVWCDHPRYLADLYVDEAACGHGAARALIEAVAAAARAHGAERGYWQTREDNARARLLYDKVAKHPGFIRYDYPMLST